MEDELSLTGDCFKDINLLADILKDLYNSMSGGEKSCGHDFTCICASDRARKMIDLLDDKK